MNFKNVWFTLLWRILIIISTAYRIYAGVFLISGETNFKILLYYTMQSNLWCLILYSYIVVKMLYQLRKHQSIQKKICSSWLKGGLTSAILVTFLLYQFIIIPYCLEHGSVHQMFSPSDISVHYLAPFLVFIDFLLFDPKKQYSWYTPFQWLSIPILYFLFVVTCSFIHVPVPEPEHPFLYFFLDIGDIGIKGFSLNMIKLTLLFLSAGYFTVFINDIKIGKK